MRVSDEEYKQIAKIAKAEHRPISNLIYHFIFNSIANMFTTDTTKTKEILENKELMESLKRSEEDYKMGRGKIVA